MANQIVVSSGAKVRDLNDVIIGTSGVLSSLAFNVSNGVPKLDVNGKILVSQLPNSVMEYLGTWNAATNTPFLVNGTGNAGDVYLCNVAGTVDFGAGPITFVVSDQVIYSGSIWQKASGSNGTVTSVAVTESGDSLNITGSPITTSGTINIGFNGTNLQYINGAGDLTTFPTLLSSVGLSMPSAFNVSNSPLTANGTIGVTGAGNASQYIRGDGTLAAYNPSTGGGGSSVSYYLNGGTNQGTFVGNTYYEMSKNAVIGTGVDFTINANGYISQFITDANDPAQLVIPAGNWNFEMYFSASSGGGSPSFYVELYKYNGSTFTLIADNSANPEYITNGTAIDLYTTAVAVPETSLTITDRLAIRVYVIHASKTITLHTQDSHLCQVITTFSTGITALNGLTAQVQFFATGTSGTDFAISSSTATHTFNLPVASAANTGKLSSTDWSTFNGKQGTITLTTTGTSGAATLVGATLNIPNYGSALTGYVPYTGATGAVNLGAFNLTVNSIIIGKGAGTGINNVSIGIDSLINNTTGTANIAIGTNSLKSSVTGVGNTAVGTNSLQDNTGGANVAFGSGALKSNTTANGNTAVGTNSLLSNTTGNGNTAVGNGTLSTNITGLNNIAIGTNSLNSSTSSGNTAVGTQALELNTTGGANTAVGLYSLQNNTTSSFNTAYGGNSLQTNTTGGNNTAVGYGSLIGNTTGIYNTAIGRSSGAAITTGNYNTIIGYYVGTSAMNNNIILADGDGNVRYQFDGTNNIFANKVNFSSTIGNGTYTYTLPSATGTLALTSDIPSLTGYVPYTGATTDVTLGTFDLIADNVTLTSGLAGISRNLVSNYGILYVKNGAYGNIVPSALYVDRTYTLPDASGTIALTSQLTSGTVTSVAALTLGTTGTDLSSTVATGTTTPVITLNVPTASATNRGALSSADWTTFNGKQSALTNPVTGTGTTNYHTKFTGTSTIGNSLIWDNGTNVGIGNTNTTYTLDVSGTIRATGSIYGDVGFRTKSLNGYLLKNDADSSNLGGLVRRSYWAGGAALDTQIFAETGYGIYLNVNGSSSTGMTITSAGNVGIGTSSPTDLLVLNITSASTVLQFQNGGTSKALMGISYAASDLINNSAASDLNIRSNNTNINFSTNNGGTLGMRITSGGNVLIGTSTDNGYRVGINGSQGMILQGGSTSGNYALAVQNAAATVNYLLVRGDGAVIISGSLSKGSGSFRINHPLESLSETHQLVHSFIEGPQADLIYRGKLTLVNGKAQANIDEVSTMTEGTFEVLCREVQCFTTNESGWDLVKGKVIGNIIYIESQNKNSTNEISWMVIGERKDKHMMDTEWTDDNGKVIVEPLKPIKPIIEIKETSNKEIITE